MMTEEEYLDLCKKHYQAIVDLNKHDSFFDHEKGMVEIVQEMGRQVMEANIGKVPENHQKK